MKWDEEGRREREVEREDGRQEGRQALFTQDKTEKVRDEWMPE